MATTRSRSTRRSAGARERARRCSACCSKAQTETPQVSAAITMTTATIVRGGQDGPVQECSRSWRRPRGPRWQRSAVLRGAEAALLGAAMPGGGRWRARGGVETGPGAARERRRRRARAAAPVARRRSRERPARRETRKSVTAAPALARAGARRRGTDGHAASSVSARPRCSRGSRGPARPTPDPPSCP